MYIQSIPKAPHDVNVHIFDKIDEMTWYLDIQQAAKKMNKRKTYVDLTTLNEKYRIPAALIIFKQLYKLTDYTSSAYEVHLYLIESYEISSYLRSLVIGSDLSTQPANKLCPEMFCKKVRKLFKKSKVKVSCLDEKEMKKFGLNLVLGVGMGSQNPPRFLILELENESRNAKTACLVGKGVIFDSGGYNLKPGINMTTMKGDKTGGGTVVSIMHYFQLNPRQTPYHLIGIIPLVENLISHKAQKIGDVVTAFNGKTVEILNTDAEGRLILADALSYATKMYEPDLLLDFATLTGWANVLHCDTSFVYFTTNDEISKKIEKSALITGEKNIRMPNWPEYIRYTKSDIADLKNVGFNQCQKSDGFMASMFLLNFVKKDTWVHFDITHSNNKNMHFVNSAATAIEFLKMI